MLLTGPFARADAETVSRHLAALKEVADGQLLEIYSILGLRSVKIAGEAGVDSGSLDRIRQELMMAISESE